MPYSTSYVRGQGRIFRMWPVKLRPGVTTDEFERFLKEDWVEVLWSAPGVRSYVLKGNRGTGVGHYLIVSEYDRVLTRDLYSPETGASDLWKQLSAEGLATPESIRAETRWAELVVPEWSKTTPTGSWLPSRHRRHCAKPKPKGKGCTRERHTRAEGSGDPAVARRVA